ncbi:glycosyltransferase [Candidatus Parcubacteria bacterium]|nr:MAG: glycosyltransferase [Candidatus Parcubacteria bacterium]
MIKYLPKLSIVTPSYNQVSFLEDTILSVLIQQYISLEYIIIDGGSTDGSIDVIKKYQTNLAHWESKSDEGMYDAINRGFEKSSGEVMAYINSDDLYLPEAFNVVAELFARFPNIEWITGRTAYIDEHGNHIDTAKKKLYSRLLLKSGFYQSPYCYVVNQNAVFWRRSLWDKIGGRIDERLKLAGDFSLWVLFAEHAQLYWVDFVLSAFRRHKNQKSFNKLGYMRESKSIKKPSTALLLKILLGHTRLDREALAAPLITKNDEGEWNIKIMEIPFRARESLRLVERLGRDKVKAAFQLIASIV